MLLATLGAGTTALTNKEIEAAVHKLGFKFTTANADVPASSGNARDKAIADFAAVCGSAILTIVKQDGVTNETLIQRIALKDIGEISTFQEGVISLEKNTAGTHWTVEFTIEIGRHAAFKLDDNCKLILNIENKVSNAVLEVEAIDHPVVSNEFIQYENKFINANTTKDFPVPQHYGASIPVAALTTLDLHYANGKVLTYTPSELRKMSVDSQDPVFLYNNLPVFGIGAWFTLSLSGVVKIAVTTNASVNIVLIKEVTV